MNKLSKKAASGRGKTRQVTSLQLFELAEKIQKEREEEQKRLIIQKLAKLLDGKEIALDNMTSIPL